MLPHNAFLLALLQLGFTKPRSYPRAGELLPHRFAVFTTLGEVVFLSVALSAGHPAPLLIANLPYEVPTFLSERTPSDHPLNPFLLDAFCEPTPQPEALRSERIPETLPHLP